jgi:hypothetical protein
VPVSAWDWPVVSTSSAGPTSDVILTEEAEVAPYEWLYQRIREAALSPEESAKLLTEAADALPDN